MNYKVIVFDFDGTLADSFDLFVETMKIAAKRHGFSHPQAEEMDALRGMSGLELMRHLGIPGWKVPAISTSMRRLMTKSAARVRLYPGIAEMLKELKAAGLHTAIATSNSNRSVKIILGDDVQSHVDFLECGASLFGKHSKLLKIARAAKATPREVLYVGDELRDANAATAVKVDFAGVAWGYARPDVLQPRSVAGVFTTPQQIVQFIRGQAS